MNNFKDNLVFEYDHTGKNTLLYNDCQEYFYIEDYQGNIEEIKQRCGACLLPSTYVLAKSLDYTNTIKELSSDRAIYKEPWQKNILKL